MAKERSLIPDRANEIFRFLEAAAMEGRRCPTNPEIAAHLETLGLSASAGGVPAVLGRLAREGKIIVRIYARNWRQVLIVSGPLQGAQTSPPSRGGEPHFVIAASGASRTPRQE
jgi:hypothetical protein